jgi:hypothetical protein
MNIHFRKSLLALFLFSCGMSPMNANAQPVVVELFTSQGCSSCPPADALLGEIARRPNVIALSYHVDYWDELGWKDPFAMPAATQRQRIYVRRLAKSGAFTPQAIVSGDTSFIGSNRADMNRALAADRDALAIGLSKVGASLQIDFQEAWRESMDVYVISYLDEATTQITAGENARRTVKGVNIVRSLKRLAPWNGMPRKLAVPLASLAADATDVVVLLQRPGQGAIAGAATMRLH